MKSLTEHPWFEVAGRRGFVNITATVEELVKKSGVREGLCLVNAMHITASVFINDAEEEFSLYRHLENKTPRQFGLNYICKPLNDLK